MIKVVLNDPMERHIDARHAFENRNNTRLGTCVPVLSGSASVQNEWILAAGLLGKRLPLDTEELCLAIGGSEVAIRVKSLPAPLQTAALFDRFPRHSAVVAHPARRDALPPRAR